MPATEDEIRIREASFPRPFTNGLEFNAPVHGNWNIVHIGLQMPEAVQIYVCARNCMRGVVLTAAEMNAQDRFSFVILSENDMVRGRLDEVTVNGVIDVIHKRQKAGMPVKAVQLFPVCVHHFLGTDMNRIYRILEDTFPEIDFYRAWMDPIMQKRGYTPDQKLRRAMFTHFQEGEPAQKTAAILGGNFRLDEDSDICRILSAAGYEIRQIQDCGTYEEFLQMGETELFLCVSPPALMGVTEAARRLGRRYLYLPASFDLEEIRSQQEILLHELQSVEGKNRESAGLPEEIRNDLRMIEEDLHRLREKLGETPVTIDYMVHPRPLGLAKLLLLHGIHVTAVYLDVISPEEEEAFIWLRENAPDLILSATIHVSKRKYVSEKTADVFARASRGDVPASGEDGMSQADGRILAVGPKAAYFSDTPYFVNMVEGFGFQGVSGIRKVIALMSEAFDEEKDTRDLVPRKGLGCECCL